jgi:hypothetical protein
VAKFVTIGYGDEARYELTSPEVRDAAHALDPLLINAGALVGRAGQPVRTRNPEPAGVRTENEAFMETSLPIAGFAIVEAPDMDQAIKMVSASPCAVAHGVV